VKTEEAEVKSVKVADHVELSVSRLTPGSNYTLLIYAKNSFGRSPSAFSLYARTGGMKFIPIFVCFFSVSGHVSVLLIAQLFLCKI